MADGLGLGLEVSGRVGPDDCAACHNVVDINLTICLQGIRESDGPSNEIIKVLEEIKLLELSHHHLVWLKSIDGSSREVLVWIHCTVVTQLFERVVLLTDTIVISCAPSWGIALLIG